MGVFGSKVGLSRMQGVMAPHSSEPTFFVFAAVRMGDGLGGGELQYPAFLCSAARQARTGGILPAPRYMRVQDVTEETASFSLSIPATDNQHIREQSTARCKVDL